MIETMTVEEARVRLRKAGLGMGVETLRSGIKQGVYPFGIYIETVHGNAVFQVFTKLLEEWIAERSTTPMEKTEASA